MIKIDKKTIKQVEKRLGAYQKKAPLVISRALNRAATSGRTAAVKKAKEDYTIKSRDVRETIEIKKASKDKLGALIKSNGKRLGLEKFKISPKAPRPGNPPKVLKVGVKKNGLKKLLGAFAVDIQGTKVFEREKHAKHVKRPDGQYTQLPIKRLYGPAVPQILGNKTVRAFVENEIEKTFNKRLDHEIKRVLERSK